MDTELHPIAARLADAERTVARRKAALMAAKAKCGELRSQLTEAILLAIERDPAETNVSLAARFGLRSETSVRNLRLKRGDDTRDEH
ncbi:MAG: hypothetical protein A2V57_01165 [Candidatus Aminicenantes bacterium RBG_19FT_COMBO_65_30]|nr:MAG: hypothetical protein A2V57_01165 [Candidatus Aminicenantes bacterium RBG_19FT_COMBO_65_30]